MSKLLNHFGLSQRGRYEARQALVYRDLLQDVIRERSMAAIAGPVGAGKTTLMNQVMEMMPSITFVHLVDDKDSGIRMGSIQESIVRSLTSDSPRRSSAARTFQVIQLLGEKMDAGHPVCLIIDDAHRLHSNTLGALKILRERQYNKKAQLLSVVMIGWPRLKTMVERRDDVACRTHVLELSEKAGWMTQDERLRYIQQVYPRVCSDDAAVSAAIQHTTFALIDHHMRTYMAKAKAVGLRRIDLSIVKPTDAYALYEKLKDLHGITQQQIGHEAGGLSYSTVSRALRSVNDPHHATVVAAMQRIVAVKGDAHALAA